MAVDPAKLRIVKYPDPVLRKKAKAIGEITEEVRAVARRMLELMRAAPGVGLAAPQVGVSWRLFVANDSPESDPAQDRVYINPKLVDASRDTEDFEEGCLSLADIRADIRRPKGITVVAKGLDGVEFTQTSRELAARIWQHEYDHLDGVLILDRMAPIDRKACRRAIKELEDAWGA